jgi:hypothetical protein
VELKIRLWAVHKIGAASASPSAALSGS